MAGTGPRLSGWVLLDEAHGVDSTWVLDVGQRSWTRGGINAVRHQNSVFHGLLKHVPWDAFDRLVDGAWRRRAGAPAVDQEPVRRPALRPAFRRREPARDRRRPAEPRRAALSSRRPAGLRARRSRMPMRSARPRCSPICSPHMMRQAHRGLRRKHRRDDLPDRFDQPAAERAQRRLGALLGQRLRRQAACDLRSRRRSRRSTPRSAPPRSTTSPPPRRCRSSRAPPTSSTSATTIIGWWADAGSPRGCRIVTRLQAQHAAHGHRDPAGARWQSGPLRPHRLPARPPGQQPPQPDAGRGARGPRARPRPARCCAS